MYMYKYLQTVRCVTDGAALAGARYVAEGADEELLVAIAGKSCRKGRGGTTSTLYSGGKDQIKRVHHLKYCLLNYPLSMRTQPISMKKSTEKNALTYVTR